jgi:putative GTP pyrophosphokinase
MATSGLVPISIGGRNFNILMSLYDKALEQVKEELTQIKKSFNKIYGYDIINNITTRIKTPNSIVNKMQKKHYEMNYKNLIENINDIAGIRVTCPLKNDIYKTVNVIKQIPNVRIVKIKDYIKKPKESGYSGYHLIVETDVEVNDEVIPVKVEIQLRTMAMDFWATNEHKMKYKSTKKLSFWDSKKLTIYAKLVNFLDNKIMRIHKKQENI